MQPWGGGGGAHQITADMVFYRQGAGRVSTQLLVRFILATPHTCNSNSHPKPIPNPNRKQNL